MFHVEWATDMQSIECTSNQFFDLMTNPAFIRTGDNFGKMRDKIYFCEVPPERKEGFITEKIDIVIKSLNVIM